MYHLASCSRGSNPLMSFPLSRNCSNLLIDSCECWRAVPSPRLVRLCRGNRQGLNPRQAQRLSLHRPCSVRPLAVLPTLAHALLHRLVRLLRVCSARRITPFANVVSSRPWTFISDELSWMRGDYAEIACRLSMSLPSAVRINAVTHAGDDTIRFSTWHLLRLRPLPFPTLRRHPVRRTNVLLRPLSHPSLQSVLSPLGAAQ